MKKSELIKLIKTSVREEIESCLPKIINELLTDKPVKSVDPVEIASEVLSVGRTKKKKELKTFTRNEVLNQVLNETVGGIPQEGGKVQNPSNNFTDLNGQPVEVDQLPDHVSNALTRDYSKLLGAVDKKKKQKMGIL